MRWTSGNALDPDIRSVVSGSEKMEPPDNGFSSRSEGSVLEIVAGCGSTSSRASFSGSEPTFGRWTVASVTSYTTSPPLSCWRISFHIYLSTIGEPGTFQAMTRVL